MKLTKAERAARQALKLVQPTAVKEAKPKAEKPVEQATEPRPMLSEVPIERWKGCYDESWRGAITPESFAHPAKAGRALLGQIYDRLFKMGALSIGSTVVDPFGGIGTTGIIGAWRGVRVICHELEPKFVALAQSNFDLHLPKWEVLNHPLPRIVQGDSRKLRQSIASANAVISSPPYSELGSGVKSGKVDETKWTTGSPGRKMGSSHHEEGYGDTPGQLGTMDAGHVDAVVSSPPYSAIASGAGGLNTLPSRNPDEQTGRSMGASQDTDQRYGDAEGQLAKLTEGAVDAVVSSPPYVNDALGHSRGVAQDVTPGPKCEQAQVVATEYGTEPGQLDQLASGTVDAIISSPPYEKSIIGQREVDIDYEHQRLKAKLANGSLFGRESIRKAQQGINPHSNEIMHDYGKTSGQLGAMKTEGVDAVIASPPYEAAISERGGRQGDIEPRIDPNTGKPFPQEHDLKPYGDTPGQLGSLSSEGVDAIVSSPPFGGQQDQPVIGQGVRKDMEAAGRNPSDSQQSSPGNLAVASMDETVDAVLTSPPYGDTGLGGSAQSEGPNGRPTDNKGASQPLDQYGTSEGQLNHANEETFWSAARDIVRECHAILKPGGYAVWIVKAFVRNKEIVDFPGDWRRLCEYVGFETITEVHAMLVKETEYTDIFGEDRVDKKERKSFFRRLAESKGSPKIDHEVVYIMRKR